MNLHTYQPTSEPASTLPLPECRAELISRLGARLFTYTGEAIYGLRISDPLTRLWFDYLFAFSASVPRLYLLTAFPVGPQVGLLRRRFVLLRPKLWFRGSIVRHLPTACQRKQNIKKGPDISWYGTPQKTQS